MKRALILGCWLAIVVLSQRAQAQITNGSFEAGGGSLTGWTTANGPLGVTNGEGKTDGNFVAVFNGGSGVGNGILSQNFTTTPGQRYRLQFDYGAFGASEAQRMTVSLTGSGTLASQNLNVNGRGGSPGPTTWQRHNILFTANSASTTLAFADTTTAAPSNDGNIDRVSVSTYSSVLNPGGAGVLGTINFVGGELSRNGAPNAVGLSPSATQSSTCCGGNAINAIDGNTSGSGCCGGMTHTNGAVGDTWQVALGTLPGQPNAPNHSYAISRIDIFNRIECCSSRLSEFNVDVLAGGSPVDLNIFDLGTPNAGNTAGGVSGNNGAQDHDGTPGDDGLSIRLAPNTVGDSVRVTQNFAAALTLAEVQAFGLATYVQDAADALNIDISATGNDFVNVQQQAILDGTLNTTLLGGYNPSPGTVFNVLSTPTGQLDISGLTVSGNLFAARVANIGGRDFLQLVTLPEPTSIALWLLLGVTIGGVWLKKRRK